jgi:excinuclease UvrABC nuclease subunit
MNEQELEQKLIAAYDKMMGRINAMLNSAEQHALPTLQQNIEKAKLQAIELKRIIEAFSNVADKTRLELAQLATQAKIAQQYHTGEITTVGTLSCESCATTMNFKKTSRIPPCPKCHKTIFVRQS